MAIQYPFAISINLFFCYCRKITKVYLELHAELLNLTKDTTHQLATKSDHYVHLQKSEIVVNEILRVLQKTGYNVDD